MNIQIKTIEIYFKVHKGLRSFMVWAIGEKKVFLGTIFADEVGNPQEQTHKLLFYYKKGAALKNIKVTKRGDGFYCASPQWHFPSFSVLMEDAKKKGVVFPPYVPPFPEKENWWDK